jgi:hypothetical protein
VRATVSHTELASTTSVSLPGNVYSLSSDPDRNSIWYAVMAGAGRPMPYEADAKTGVLKDSVELPAAVGDGGLSDDVRVGPDGSVWVSESYAIVKVDPTTGQVTSIPLAQHVDGELATANSTTNPGTWTTSMTVTSDSVVVARNNVPFLQQWSFDLTPVATIPLPNGGSGPNDMRPTTTGLDLVYSQHDGVGNANIHDIVPMPPGSAVPVSRQGVKLSPAYLTYRAIGSDAELEGATGVVAVSKNPTTGMLDWQTSKFGVRQISWPAERVQVSTPVGGFLTALVQATLDAATLTSDGALWIVRSGPTVQLTRYAP